MGILKKIAGWIVLLIVVVAGVKIYIDSLPKPTEATGSEHEQAPQESSLALNEKQVASLKLEPARTATFVAQLAAVGNIDFNQNQLVQVFTPYAGRIIQAIPNVGDKIEAGSLLFTIDSPDLLAAENTLITAAGVFNLQSKTLQRVKKMETFGGASQQAVDQSTSDQMSAEGALKATRDAVRIFGKTPEEIDKLIAERKADPRLVVASPISGYVTARSASPGLFVQPGVAPPPFTLADLSTMWMLANVPESDAPKIKVGQQVRARVAAFPDEVFDGVVTVLGPSVDPNTRRVFVRSEVSDPGHRLKAGMFANFTIRVAEDAEVVAVPTAAVVREGDGTQTLWVTSDRKRFTRRIVEIGREQAGRVEVLTGLKANELVVAEGAVFLSNKLAGGAPE